MSANKKYITSLFIDPRLKPFRHLALLFSLLLLFSLGEDVYVSPMDDYVKIGAIVFFLLLLYFNVYVLVPLLLFKGKPNGYFFSVVLLIVICFCISSFANEHLKPYRVVPDYNAPGLIKGFIGFFFILFVIIAASTSIRLFQQRIADHEQINALGKLSMEAELEQLKNQINPHFLFNMLNNANVLVYTNPDKASQVLHKLSDLLRYQLYDSARDKVLLTGEIHFLTDFLNLEKVRRDNFNFRVSKEGDISGIQVPPFLFITFVENAVKHNLDPEKASYVDVFFSIVENELQFVCINSKPSRIAKARKTGGLGLINVKRRLQLLYGDSYSLSVNQDEQQYNVILRINI